MAYTFFGEYLSTKSRSAIISPNAIASLRPASIAIFLASELLVGVSVAVAERLCMVCCTYRA